MPKNKRKTLKLKLTQMNNLRKNLKVMKINLYKRKMMKTNLYKKKMM